MKILRTRHLYKAFPAYAQSDARPDGRDYMPLGINVEKPWPEAKVLMVEEADGWLFVYWIDIRLTQA